MVTNKVLSRETWRQQSVLCVFTYVKYRHTWLPKLTLVPINLTGLEENFISYLGYVSFDLAALLRVRKLNEKSIIISV